MFNEYDIEVRHNGDPIHVVTLQDTDEASACRRARLAVFMAALKDGREYPLDTITAVPYHGPLEIERARAKALDLISGRR